MLDPDGRLGVRVREILRRYLRLVGGRSKRDVEYGFVLRHVGEGNPQILDVEGRLSLAFVSCP